MCLMKESWENNVAVPGIWNIDRIYRDCSNHILMESVKHDLANHRSVITIYIYTYIHVCVCAKKRNC